MQAQVNSFVTLHTIPLILNLSYYFADSSNFKQNTVIDLFSICLGEIRLKDRVNKMDLNGSRLYL